MNSNPLRDDPLTGDGHLLAPEHPLRKLSGLMVSSVRVFLYRAPEGRTLEYFHPGKHDHRFTPSPYRHVLISGHPQIEFFTDTRFPAAPCPVWAFADAQGLDYSTFRIIHYLWHVGAEPLTAAAPTDSTEIASLLNAFFTALRQFPADWTPCPPWNRFHTFTRAEMEEI